MHKIERDEYLEVLGLLQEEAAEVIQALSKIRRFGPDFRGRGGKALPNSEELKREIIDFLILLELAQEVGLVRPLEDPEYVEYKIQKLKDWSGLTHAIQRVQERNSL